MILLLKVSGGYFLGPAQVKKMPQECATRLNEAGNLWPYDLFAIPFAPLYFAKLHASNPVPFSFPHTSPILSL